MKKIKAILDPVDVELISDALNVAWDNDEADDMDALEDLCQLFNVLRTNYRDLKITEGKRNKLDKSAPVCNCGVDCGCVGTDDDMFVDDGYGIDDDDVDPDAVDHWDADEDTPEDTKPEQEDAWNANRAWSVDDK